MSFHRRLSRRGLLAGGLGSFAGLLTARLARATGRDPAACADATPRQAEGPFYPTRDRDDEDMDLTRVAGRSGRAEGEVVHVRGRVLDEDCQPIDGAIVEIWQANTWGRYDHELDTENPRPLDPNFQSWAEVRTGSDGHYRFTTIKPGSYPAGDGWIRPPHIHFKVTRRGYHDLITQMYFEGEPLNEPDRLRRALSPEEQGRVTIRFEPADDREPGATTGTFDITLRKAAS